MHLIYALAPNLATNIRNPKSEEWFAGFAGNYDIKGKLQTISFLISRQKEEKEHKLQKKYALSVEPMDSHKSTRASQMTNF